MMDETRANEIAKAALANVDPKNMSEALTAMSNIGIKDRASLRAFVKMLVSSQAVVRPNKDKEELTGITVEFTRWIASQERPPTSVESNLWLQEQYGLTMRESQSVMLVAMVSVLDMVLRANENEDKQSDGAE